MAIPLAILILLSLSYALNLQETFLLCLQLIMYLFVFILLHELGHVMAGKFVGFEFEFLTFGPISILKNSNGFKISENRDWNLIGGVTRSYLVEKSNLRKRLIVYTVGGPAFSLLLATVFFTLNYFFAMDFLFYSFLFNFLLFIATVLPLGGETFATDGKSLLILLKEDNGTEGYINNFLIINELLSVKKPRFWDQNIVKHLKYELNSNEIESQVKEKFHTLIYYYEMDVDKYGERLKALNQLMNENVTQNLKEILYSSYIFFEYLDKKENTNFFHLKTLFNQLDPSNKNNMYGYLRAKCILSLHDNDHVGALSSLSQLEKLHAHISSDSAGQTYGFMKLEKEWLQELKNIVYHKIA